MVMAHPDDEVIFGWPLFQDRSVERELLICSSDLHNRRRKRFAKRRFALQEVCTAHDVALTCLDHDAGFYRVPSRFSEMPRRWPWTLKPAPGSDAPLLAFQKEVGHRVRDSDCDAVFTHNPLGEYGHLDHKLLFDIVLRYSRVPVLITDICRKSNWAEQHEIPERIRALYYRDVHAADCRLDRALYDDCERIYRAHDAWTWGRPPIERCTLYTL